MTTAMVCTTGPGVIEGMTVSIIPSVAVVVNGQQIPGFTSNSTQESEQIVVTFDQLVDRVTVTAICSAPGDNFLIAYDSDGNELARTTFDIDPTLGQFTSTKTILATGISRLKLVPEDGSFVYYPKLCFISQAEPISQQPSDLPDNTIIIKCNITIIPKPADTLVALPILINVLPAIPRFAHQATVSNTTLTINPISIPLELAFVQAVRGLTSGSVANFFDDERVLKTVINLGNDTQLLTTRWMFDPADGSRSTILMKLYEPLPPEVVEKTQVWIDREIVPSEIDQIVVFQEADKPVIMYLRPANKNVKTAGLTGVSVEGVTLQSLFPSGSAQTSASAVSLTDPVLERYYTTDLRAAGLNIDYSNYANFIQFGSAQSRLKAFLNKMITLENYNSTLATQSLAISVALASSSLGNISGSAQYNFMVTTAQDRQDLLRSFDNYERFLYYGTGSAYSSSFSGDPTDLIYYHSQANWPKTSGSITGSPQLISVASATNGALYSGDVLIPLGAITDTSWYGKQSYIAGQYDRYNMNSLANTIPLYLQEDVQSADFSNFLALIGFAFDKVKVYADHMTDIYNRDSNPDVGLSKDLVWNVAQSVGIDLPNQYAIQDIVSYLVGSGSLPTKVYKNIAAETWKRFLHNQIFLAKTKGTMTSLNALLNTYGVRPEVIRVRESITPSPLALTGSYEVYTELTNVLTYTSGAHSFVKIPWNQVSSSTVEVRFAATAATQSVLLNADNRWTLVLQPTGSASIGSVQLYGSGSALAISSPTASLFNGSFFSVMLRYTGSGVNMTVKSYNQDQLVYSFLGSEVLPSSSVAPNWFAAQNVYLGGSSSLLSPTASFAGFVDEFRMSGEYVTDTVFDDHARYPGIYYGNTTGSAAASVFVRLSFTKPVNLGATPFLPNDSPYISSSAAVGGLNGPLSLFSASLFPNSSSFPYSMTKVYRTVQRYAPGAGTQYGSNNVVIASAPTFYMMNLDGGAQVPYLSRTTSTVSHYLKRRSARTTNRVGFYFTLADSINDSMMRSLGRIDMNSLLGDPSNIFQDNYPQLSALNQFYWNNYAYNFNLNTYIRFVKNLLGSLFTTAEEYVPVRAKLLTGMVIEPTILNRSRIQFKPLSVEGDSARRNVSPVQPSYTASTWNLDAIYPPIYTEDTVTGSFLSNFQPAIRVTNTASWFASNESYQSSIAYASGTTLNTMVESLTAPPITLLVSQSLHASFHSLTGYITGNHGAMSPTASISSQFVGVDDFSEAVKYQQYLFTFYGATSFNNLPAANVSAYLNSIASFVPGTRIQIWKFYASASAYVPSQSFMLPVVYPISDFTELNPGAFTYFMQVASGTFGRTTWMQTPLNTSANNRGTWVAGTTYKVNDYVTQPTTLSGSAAPGNGKLFLCLVSNVVQYPGGPVYPFVSNVAPALDTAHWTPMATVLSPTPQILEVVTGSVSGTVALVPYNSAYKPFSGYAINHIKFSRDNRIAYRRLRWDGCLQTQGTTIDGKLPVEVFPSAQAQLIVTQNTPPVSQNNNQSGPILDVE